MLSSSIGSEVFVSASLRVLGDIIIDGTTTTVSSSNLVVHDPLIVLADGQLGAGAFDIGLIAERGTDENVGMIWDESNNVFAFVRTSDDGTTAGDVTIDGYRDLRLDNLLLQSGTITAENTHLILSSSAGSIVYVSGNLKLSASSAANTGKLILDADNDTYIYSAGDDLLRFTIGNQIGLQYSNSVARMNRVAPVMLEKGIKISDGTDGLQHGHLVARDQDLILSSSVTGKVTVSGTLRVDDGAVGGIIEGRTLDFQVGPTPSSYLALNSNELRVASGKKLRMRGSPIYDNLGDLILSSSVTSFVHVSGGFTVQDNVGIGTAATRKLTVDSTQNVVAFFGRNSATGEAVIDTANNNQFWAMGVQDTTLDYIIFDRTAVTYPFRIERATPTDSFFIDVTGSWVAPNKHVILSSSAGSTITLSGTLKFPDGTTQTTAASAAEVTGSLDFFVQNELQVSGTIVNPVGHLILSSSAGSEVKVSGSLTSIGTTTFQLNIENCDPGGKLWGFLAGDNANNPPGALFYQNRTDGVNAFIIDPTGSIGFGSNSPTFGGVFNIFNNRINLESKPLIYVSGSSNSDFINFQAKDVLVALSNAGVLVSRSGSLILSSSVGSTVYVSGALTVQDYSAFDAKYQATGSFLSTLIPTGTTVTLDLSLGKLNTIDLNSASGDVTVTIASGSAGTTYGVKVIQGSTARDLIWPAAVLWAGSTAPVISTTDDDIDFIQFLYDGTNYLGLFNQAFA